MVSKNAGAADGFVCLEANSCKEVADVLNRHKITGKVVVAMDTYQETLDWIQKGVISATIAQKPFTMAFYGVKMLDDLHHYKPANMAGGFLQDSFAPVPAAADGPGIWADTGSTLVSAANLDQFLKSRENATADTK